MAHFSYFFLWLSLAYMQSGKNPEIISKIQWKQDQDKLSIDPENERRELKIGDIGEHPMLSSCLYL